MLRLPKFHLYFVLCFYGADFCFYGADYKVKGQNDGVKKYRYLKKYRTIFKIKLNHTI